VLHGFPLGESMCELFDQLARCFVGACGSCDVVRASYTERVSLRKIARVRALPCT